MKTTGLCAETIGRIMDFSEAVNGQDIAISRS